LKLILVSSGTVCKDQGPNQIDVSKIAHREARTQNHYWQLAERASDSAWQICTTCRDSSSSGLLFRNGNVQAGQVELKDVQLDDVQFGLIV